MHRPTSRIRLTILLLLCGAFFCAWHEWRIAPDGHAHIAVLDVGQGDGILITGPSGKQIVIDGGPDLSLLEGVGKRMSFVDRTIDLLVLSHPDLDHCFALPEMLQRYRIGAILLTGVAHRSPCYERFMESVIRQRVPVIVADPQKDIAMGDGLFIDVLWPPPVHFEKEAMDGANNTSIVLRLTYGEDSMLFTGDMEEAEEALLLASGTNLRSDILKVAHHGSKTSTSTGFLLAVDPDLAIVSAGRENRFGHPHREVIDRLRGKNVAIRSTAGEGTVEIVMDGKR